MAMFSPFQEGDVHHPRPLSRKHCTSSVPPTGQEVIAVSDNPDLDELVDVQPPEDLPSDAHTDDMEVSSSDTTSSPSSTSTSPLSDTSGWERVTADADCVLGDPVSDTTWYHDTSTMDEATGERVTVSRRVPKHDGSQGPA